jgi:hypothetical protein
MPAWNRRKPAKYEVHGCSSRCSLSVESLGSGLATTMHGWFEQADTDEQISAKSDQVGHHVSIGAVGRHRANHLLRIGTLADVDLSVDPLEDAEAPKVDHVEVLERIIAAGASKISAAKITPDVVLKAMDMHFKLTQGKAIDDTMAAIAAAMAGSVEEEPDGLEQNRSAVKTPAELAEELASVG